MKVNILTEGGGSIGLGHISRCTALYQAFEAAGVKPILIVNGGNSAPNCLRGNRHKQFDWVSYPGEILGVRKTAVVVVVVDSYFATSNIYRFFRDNCDLLVCIDDNRRIKYPAHALVVNGNIFARDLYSGAGRGQLLGPDYMLLRRPFWKSTQRIIRKRLSRVLIVSGGDDAINLTPYLADVLARKFPKYHIKVVVGHGFHNINQLQILASKRLELIYSPDAAGMKSLMLWTDVAVSACGQTLYELARTGVPMVGVMVVDNQMNNVKGWETTSAFKYAGNWLKDDKDIIIGRIVKYLKGMCPFSVRLEMSLCGRKSVDGKGPERVVSEILKRVGG